MKMNELKKQNVRYTLIGYFFLSISLTLISYFLPFYLKEQGLGILEIGFLFTLGLAIGSLVFSLIYSSIAKK